jgi:hypothetical protein
LQKDVPHLIAETFFQSQAKNLALDWVHVSSFLYALPNLLGKVSNLSILSDRTDDARWHLRLHQLRRQIDPKPTRSRRAQGFSSLEKATPIQLRIRSNEFG